MVEFGIVERASDNTIGRVLKKNALQPHRKKQWVIPPEASGAFVAAMEDVLDVYTRPHDPDRPLVCLNETSKQLVSETRTPIAMKPGQPRRADYEYEAGGTANLFAVCAAGGLSAHRGHRSPDRHLLCQNPQRLIRHPLPAGPEDHSGAGQSQHACQRPRFTKPSRPPRQGAS